MRHLVVAGAVGAMLAMTGCEAVWNSVYRETNFEGGSSLITDAKQRAIINVPYIERLDGSGLHTPKRIFCAEPSPDVAQALSTALNAGLSLDKGGGGPSGAGSLGIANAASVAQLGERLAVIQLLRDKMYRTCEAYANGAVSPTGYVLMLARLDKAMTTLLASEMAAGAFGRALATMGGSASAGGVDPEQTKALEDKVQAAADKLNALAVQNGTEKKPDATDITKAKGDLDEAIKALARHQTTAIRTAAASTVAGGGVVGQLGSRPVQISITDKDGKVVTQGVNITQGSTVAAIHQAYIDDDGLEPIADACLHRLSASTPIETITGRADFILNHLRAIRYGSGGDEIKEARLERRYLNSFTAINMALRSIGHDPLQVEPNQPTMAGGYLNTRTGKHDLPKLAARLREILEKLAHARTSGGRDALNYVCLKLFDEGGADFIERRLTSKLNSRLAGIPGASVLDIGAVDVCRTVVSAATTARQMTDGLRQSLTMCQRLFGGARGGGGGAPPRPIGINLGL